MGTTGRRCNAESQGHDGCGFLCCGRGHFTQTVVEYEKCKCKFVWCCKVSSIVSERRLGGWGKHLEGRLLYNKKSRIRVTLGPLVRV